MKPWFLVLPAMAAMLAGCQTGQEQVSEYPKAAYERCIIKVAISNISAKHEIAAFMGVSLERMPPLLCRRLVDAMKSGRLTFSDINRLQFDQSTDIWKVIKGD
ncbi:hypothetical protein NKI32_26880 [Mesorhizobium sp. M0761]|uniref:hypothetical protein n=1 Tax=Mesorhizobium sp. M0761 TaxID=2956994 RepID=UPI00333D42F3